MHLQPVFKQIDMPVSQPVEQVIQSGELPAQFCASRVPSKLSWTRTSCSLRNAATSSVIRRPLVEMAHLTRLAGPSALSRFGIVHSPASGFALDQRLPPDNNISTAPALGIHREIDGRRSAPKCMVLSFFAV